MARSTRRRPRARTPGTRRRTTIGRVVHGLLRHEHARPAAGPGEAPGTLGAEGADGSAESAIW